MLYYVFKKIIHNSNNCISALYFPTWNYSFPFEKYTSINEYIFRYWKLWRNFKSLKLLRKLVVDHYLLWTQWIFSQDMSSCLPTACLLSFWKWPIFNISNSNLLLWVLIFKLLILFYYIEETESIIVFKTL